MRQILFFFFFFFFFLFLGLVVWVRFGDLFVSQNPREFYFLTNSDLCMYNFEGYEDLMVGTQSKYCFQKHVHDVLKS